MRTRSTIRSSALLGALALGGAAMYWLDPDRGRRRRGRARDVAIHLGHEARELVDKGSRDLRHRAAGAVAEVTHGLAPDHAPDPVVVGRVRAEIGRCCSHPHAIDVASSDATVTLRGPVLRDEADEVRAHVARVRGVRAVIDELDRHDTPEHVPALQGYAARPRRRPRWSPARRLLGGATGAALAMVGLAYGSVAGAAMVVGGAALLARAAGGPGRRDVAARGEVELHKTLHIDAPLDEVFALCADVERFPKFMQHVKRVRPVPEGRWRWTVDGPAGVPVQWDAEVTSRQDRALVAWRTRGRGPVQHTGSVRFAPSNGGTRVELHVCYRPAGGVIGWAIAAALGASPKRALDEDALRLKSLLERGKTSAHGEEVSREAVSQR
jgi:uncharacterized membrane protein